MKEVAGQVYLRTDVWLLLHPSTQFLSDSLLHTSTNVSGQNGVMYNFLNKQSMRVETRGETFCISVSGCFLLALVFICLYAFFFVLSFYVLIKEYGALPPPQHPPKTHPHFSKNVAWAKAPERSLFIRLRYVEWSAISLADSMGISTHV